MLRIKRRVIEMKHIDPVERYFHRLTAEGVTSFQKVIIVFEGYDDTTEEVYEIKEVREWVYSIFRLFPHFIYFISMELDSHITLLACLGDVETIRIGSYPLTPNEYAALGIDIIRETQRFHYNIKIDDDLFMAMDFAIRKYATSIRDHFGAERILEMIRGVTNRWT